MLGFFATTATRTHAKHCTRAVQRLSMTIHSMALNPITPEGAPGKPPRQPSLDTNIMVPSFRVLGTRDVMGWSVENVKAALATHAGGQFSMSGLLADDFRLHPVISDCLDVLNSVFTLLPRKWTAACLHEDCKRPRCRRERWVRDWFQEIQPEIYPDSVLSDWLIDRRQMGQGIMAFDWEERKDGGKRYWLPVLKPWHPSQTQYFFRGNTRTVDGGMFHATSLNRGLLVVEPGMGRWALCQASSRMPWLRGAVYSLGLDWIGDEFNFLDNLAFEERFGLGLIKYFRDDQYQAGQVNQSTQAIQATGAGAVIPLRMHNGVKWEDLELEHTAGSGWEAFDRTEARILRRILLVYLGQDMTSVGQTGGYKQAVIHKDTLWARFGECASYFFDGRKRIDRDPDTGADKVTWEPYNNVLRNQITRWITWYNFRDFDLAPYYWLDATPPEDQADREERQTKRADGRGKALVSLASALPVLRQQYPNIPSEAWLEHLDIMPSRAPADSSTPGKAPTEQAEAQTGADSSSDGHDPDESEQPES